jgi:hypothetical protein
MREVGSSSSKPEGPKGMMPNVNGGV